MRRSSADTKEVILAAARERFATCGYERSTIRAIAADARIDPSMVMRYFGSKEGLFAAAARFDLELPDLGGADSGLLGRRLVGHFVQRWERDEALVVLLRAAATNAEAAQRMSDIFTTQLLPVVAAAGEADTEVDAGTRAGLVATQMLGLALCRYVLRLPPVVALTRAQLEDWLGPTIQRYLDTP
ncbi:TetR family transcriptional regulator [Mycobacterium sp. WMMD1722]|uniref:TetR/AcrR family transcriptional regulator n=1 Tax=Mycobacterium sp. WMMD1722 TaxID=3404117 RepID=UPI003BF5269F